jgi:ankyrin repeat protein
MSFNLLEESAFIQACATADEKKTKELLATNSELIEKVASNGSAPLMFAISKGSFGIVDLLLRNKADINALSPKGSTALWFAAGNKQWSVAVKLIDAGAKNLDATPAEGRGTTALWLAAVNEQWPLLVKLLERVRM